MNPTFTSIEETATVPSICKTSAQDKDTVKARRALRVVQLTSMHAPLDVRIFYKHARTLAAAGHQVTVLAPEIYAPRSNEEPVEDVTIKTFPKSASRLERVSRTMWRLYRLAIAEDADVYHFHDPELIPLGLLLKARGKKVIYDVHEDLPQQILVKKWIPRGLRALTSRCAAAVEFVAGHAFDGIVTATPRILRRFPPARSISVQNFPGVNELLNDDVDTVAVPYAERRPVLAYVGSVSRIRGVMEMISAVALVQPRFHACLVIAGPFSPHSLEQELRELVESDSGAPSPSKSQSKVELLGWQARVVVRELLSQARIGLVLLHPTTNYMESQPLKLFEYMSAGLPVIASDFPAWRAIVEECQCGLLVDPLDPAAIARAVEQLLDNPKEAEAMGRRGREAVIRTYNWTPEARKLIAFYDRLAGK